jgi:hypothetical protein
LTLRQLRFKPICRRSHRAKQKRPLQAARSWLYVGSLEPRLHRRQTVRADKGSALIVSRVLRRRYDSNSDVPLFFITSSKQHGNTHQHHQTLPIQIGQSQFLGQKGRSSADAILRRPRLSGPALVNVRHATTVLVTPNIESFSSVQRCRRWTMTEKVRIVEKTFEVDMR